MAIEKKSLKDITSAMRSVYQKAVAESQKPGNHDYALELLKGIIQREPGFIEGRDLLRQMEVIHSKKLGIFGKIIAQIKSGTLITKAKMNATKDVKAALGSAEEALALYLFSPVALNTLADVALTKGADAPFIAIEALELIREFDPSNEPNLNRLCEIYENLKDGPNALKIRQQLANMHPDNLEMQGKVREAAALATMSNNWSKEAGAGQKKTDQKADKTVGDKIIRAEEDILAEIQAAEEKIAAKAPEADSIDFRRKLSEFYMRLERYEDALNVFEWIEKKMGTLDPAIDKLIEKANIGIVNNNVKLLKEQNAPDAEAKIEEQKKALFEYRMGRAKDRVRLYPNDLQLRFELAELDWEHGLVDEALEQFQLAQRQPQRRLQAIVYLGRCFHAKKQYDMAVEQFQKGLQDMLTMNEQKMDTLYYLGLTYEDMGNKKDALDCFKQIYSTDITFRDVKDRVMSNYGK